MKKILFILILAFKVVLFSAEADLYAGASLNEKEVKREYNRLMKAAKRSIKYDDWFLRESTIDEIEIFMDKINQIGKADQKYVQKYRKNMNIAIKKLLRVDGMAGASLDPKKLMAEYKLTLETAELALTTGQGKEKAVKEIEELLKFMQGMRPSQSKGAIRNIDIFDRELRIKLMKLKK